MASGRLGCAHGAGNPNWPGTHTHRRPQFKLLCRQFGFMRWPNRKLNVLRNLELRLNDFTRRAEAVGQVPEELAKWSRYLQDVKRVALADPSTIVVSGSQCSKAMDELTKLRQWSSKLLCNLKGASLAGNTVLLPPICR